LLPFREIWEQILVIQSSFALPFNIKKTDSEVGLSDILDLKSEFLLMTIEYCNKLEDIMRSYDWCDFTYRYKDDYSVERKWNNRNITKPLHKTINDILGMRFILKTNEKELLTIVEQFQTTYPSNEINSRVVDMTDGKSENDGYKGIHVYIRKNNYVFPIEVQFWSRADALINDYLRENIYTKFDDPEVKTYSNQLRRWMEKVPKPSDEYSIMSYVDYIYERAFHHFREE
jgi:hypothetical protein